MTALARLHFGRGLILFEAFKMVLVLLYFLFVLSPRRSVVKAYVQGESFRLQETARETHPTPLGSTQEFWYSRLKRVT